jgi:glycosyltransferase involved in cell wall biosynthesis
MRYAWHMRRSYFGSHSRHFLKHQAIEMLLARLRQWDRRTADRVTHFIAISRTVQRRIAECYGRTSSIIYPPVDTEFYCPAPVPRENYFLLVSAFAPYKRIDLAIKACTELKRNVLVIGTGPVARHLRVLAGPTVTFLGWQPDETIRHHMRRCRALLFPGEEDFGIVPVEAQACGTPVIAFGRGGATESVIPLAGAKEPTGIWFSAQTPDGLAAAIREFETRSREFSPEAARRNALTFNRDRFEREMLAFLNSVRGTAPIASRRAA